VTYYGRAANEHVDLTLAVVVEGIPYALVERTIAGAPSGLGGRTQIVCVTRVEEGEATLNHDERREEAATLDIDLLDTSAHDLRSLFAAGSRATGWITTPFTAADTTLEVNSTTPYSAGQNIYVGAETITIGTITAPSDLVGCTRGAFSTTATVLNGTSTDGDSVYTVPPYWRGRRVKLYGYTPQGDETLLGVYIVDESPRHVGDEQWTLRCAGVVQEYWERSVGVGLREQPVLSVVSSTASLRTLAVQDASAFRLASSFPTYVIVSGGDRAGIFELTGVDTGTDQIEIAPEPSFRTTSPFNRGADGFTVRPLAVVGGSSPLLLLYVLLSSEGQASTSYDRLPGRPASDTYDPGWRMGAGFTTSEVDTSAFEVLRAIPPQTITIVDERRVTDILREWCLLTGTAVVSTVDGKIKPITLAAQRTANTTSIGADDIVPDTKVEVEHDESGVFPLLTVRAGYDPVSGDFSRTINLIDTDLAKRYRRNPQRREIEVRSIGVGSVVLPENVRLARWVNPTSVSLGEMAGIVNDVMRGDGALARRFLRLSLTHEHLDLRIGDLVTLSSSLQDAYSSLPDFRGSTVAGVTARVVARRPRYDQGRVDVRLEILDRLLHVCPAVQIKVVAGNQVQLRQTQPELTSASPTDDFWVGAGVHIIDRSQGGGAGTGYFTVVDTIDGPDTLTLGGVPDAIGDGWTIQDNVDVMVLDPETSIATGPSTSGYELVEAAMLAGDDGVAGTNPDATTEPRWR